MKSTTALLLCLITPVTLWAQESREAPRSSGLAVQLEPMSEQHLERFRTPSAMGSREISSGDRARLW